jgi:DNA-binding beta-propeller fold protein YncE
MMRRALLLCLLALLVAPPAAEAAFVRVDGFGGPGRGRGDFGPPRASFGAFLLGTSPAGIAVAGSTVLVSDPLNHRIHRFTKRGRSLGSFGRKGIEPRGANMLAPQGLVAHRGSVFVAMNGNDRVDIFRRGRWRGMFYVRFNVRRVFGFSRGAGFGQLHNPYGLARSPRTGLFYVADLLNSRVNRYNARGFPRGTVGSFGAAPGQFLAPFGIAVDAAGDVWASDRELNRLQKFDGQGRLLLNFGETGAGPGEFRSPAGLAVDRSGNVYVADTVNRRIQRFAPDGRFLESFGGGILRQPTYVAVDSSCRAFVADYRRVVVFRADSGC